jgi:hypothetical protein
VLKAEGVAVESKKTYALFMFLPLDPLLLVIVGLVITLCALGLFFEVFWKKFPWAEKPINGLKIWGVIMVLVLLFGIVVS